MKAIQFKTHKLRNNKIGPTGLLRLCVSLVAIILPIIFLIKGIFGSFIFSFSIPLIWQIGFLGEPFSSLGLRRNQINQSIIVGIISGCILGLVGGSLLKLFGLTGFGFTDIDKLQYSLGLFNISFQLHNELGYRLLTMSNSLIGLSIYLIFCIFVIGLGEELLWRGFIQKKLYKYFSKNISVWITAILFSLIHTYIFTIMPFKQGILFLIIIAFVGALWGYLFKYFDNIWSCAISHGIVAFIVWKYYFFALLK
jgi:membrane protease YdiL (CAAX protease family)